MACWRMRAWALLRIALLFGSVAVALALLIAPMLDIADTVLFADGSADGHRLPEHRFDQRRRQLTRSAAAFCRHSPNSVCIIRDNGTRSGDC